MLAREMDRLDLAWTKAGRQAVCFLWRSYLQPAGVQGRDNGFPVVRTTRQAFTPDGRRNPEGAEEDSRQMQEIRAGQSNQRAGVTDYRASHGVRSSVSCALVSSGRTTSIPSSPR